MSLLVVAVVQTALVVAVELVESFTAQAFPSLRRHLLSWGPGVRVDPLEGATEAVTVGTHRLGLSSPRAVVVVVSTAVPKVVWLVVQEAVPRVITAQEVVSPATVLSGRGTTEVSAHQRLSIPEAGVVALMVLGSMVLEVGPVALRETAALESSSLRSVLSELPDTSVVVVVVLAEQLDPAEQLAPREQLAAQREPAPTRRLEVTRQSVTRQSVTRGLASAVRPVAS